MPDQSLLIVDDDPRICRLIKRVAMAKGFACHIVEDSDLFVNAYLEIAPSLILLDLKMKGLDGVELMRHLATLESNSSIVIMSGVDNRVLDTTQRLGDSLGLHMAGVLPKPIDIDSIETILTSHRSRSKQGKQEYKSVNLNDLEQAIANKDLYVHYQPQIDLSTNQVIGFESLCRWQHKELGLISPEVFIPLAEKNNLIKEVTELVLEKVISEIHRFKPINPQISISVNLSALLLSDLQIPDAIEAMLVKYNVPAQHLIMEVTESAAMEEPSRTMEILTRLRLKDIRVSMDDFGTGYSSLVQLYRFPFSELKVDKSFVIDMLKSDEAAAIVKSTINIGQTLGLKVVAEGIENSETQQLLKSLNCDAGQGYHISKPMPVDECLNWSHSFLKTA